MLIGGDSSGLYYIVNLYSSIIVYPFALVIGTGFFRQFPDRMNARRSRRALATGAVAGILIWSGLGEWVLIQMEQLYRLSKSPDSAVLIVLILCTPFAMFLTLGHLVGLCIPPGKIAGRGLPIPPYPRVVPRRRSYRGV